MALVASAAGVYSRFGSDNRTVMLAVRRVQYTALIENSEIIISANRKHSHENCHSTAISIKAVYQLYFPTHYMITLAEAAAAQRLHYKLTATNAMASAFASDAHAG